ncbi:MAG: universal stress protein [endosymbiont of Galathealinum brachiosum]|uniref:Universal stress protein n=1 Tax=endosymbiont of Galathealinum brachiosum TaxID=2200906 RepID=A0A370DIN6_9GAMM|nr:MAG: universal stress protein [endosymbiont of Galathealinum brachiosum]
MSDYSHILIAIDFASSAEQVLNKARDIADRNNAKLSLLHIVEYLPPIDSVYEPVLANNWIVDETEMLSQAKVSLEKFSKQQKLINAELHTALGTPKYEISQFVKDHQCDLVVIGSHGRHGINILLGSTANAVLHEMPCDILAVKIEN